MGFSFKQPEQPSAAPAPPEVQRPPDAQDVLGNDAVQSMMDAASTANDTVTSGPGAAGPGAEGPRAGSSGAADSTTVLATVEAVLANAGDEGQQRLMDTQSDISRNSDAVGGAKKASRRGKAEVDKRTKDAEGAAPPSLGDVVSALTAGKASGGASDVAPGEDADQPLQLASQMLRFSAGRPLAERAGDERAQ